MVNKQREVQPRPVALVAASRIVATYVALTIATVVALIVLSRVAPAQATTEAWVHALIVLGFAVLLPLRLRSARRGSGRAIQAVVIIAGVLLAVNVVEALLPHVFPGWMRIEMAAAALLMAGLVAVGVTARRTEAARVQAG